MAIWPKSQSQNRGNSIKAAALKYAIDRNDLAGVQELMTADASLHRAPLGYGEDGPLTWVAECRVPWEPPSAARLAMAAWMIEHGSDVHQGGDGPLMRAALNPDRVAMMELLVAHGADVNAQWHGDFPILWAPCESLNPVSLAWLLAHGADPNPPGRDSGLDYLIAGYVRSLEGFRACLELLLAAGGKTRFDAPPVLALLRGRLDELGALLDATPGLVHARFPQLDCGQTGGRLLLLTGATLLHVAAEYGDLNAARLLLERGADANAPATINAEGIGGQTPLFHAATQFDDEGLPMVELLLAHGADSTLRARVPGDYEQPGEVMECSAAGYAGRFGGPQTRERLGS